MIYIFLGPPGSGKDTQISYFQKYVNLPNISTGELFREAIRNQTEIGKEAEAIVKAGNWPSDEMAFALVKERVAREDCKEGFILNGFPRRIGQVFMTDELVKERGETLKAVVHFDLSEEVAMKRLLTQIKDQPGRPDTEEAAIRNRFNEHVVNSGPILEEYEKRGVLVRIDAAPTREEIFADMAQKLEITPDGREKS